MAKLSADTDPEMERLQIERLRLMPPWRKVALMGEMSQTVRMLALAGLRQRYPQDTPEHRKRRLADLLFGTRLADRVYGPAPKDEEC
jgi:hypothetical protein